jgi:hypothetical protein
MSDIEGVGEAITGAIVGRAVEPRGGEPGDGHTTERNCLNCGCSLGGDYCHRCGQQAHVHRTLGAFWHDLLHGVLHFEGKIWRTLPLLAWKPGELTRRYVEGERAKFVSPIALFLFCVFLTFAVVGLTGALNEAPMGMDPKDVAVEMSRAQASIKDLEIARAGAARSGKPTAEIEEELADARAELEAVRTVSGGLVKLDTTSEADSMPSWLRGWVGNAAKNPELLFYKLKTNAYKFSWALIPISVPFVWLLFPFSRRFRMYDHTVFVTYSLCFMMLLLLVGTTVGMMLPALAAFAWFLPPIHMYRQLRGTYAVGRFGALWRTVALTLFAFVAISLFTSLLVGVGEFS